jgi:hypothetical protein
VNGQLFSFIKVGEEAAGEKIEAEAMWHHQSLSRWILKSSMFEDNLNSSQECLMMSPKLAGKETTPGREIIWGQKKQMPSDLDQAPARSKWL